MLGREGGSLFLYSGAAGETAGLSLSSGEQGGGGISISSGSSWGDSGTVTIQGGSGKIGGTVKCEFVASLDLVRLISCCSDP
jgi:hypothetical protein